MSTLDNFRKEAKRWLKAVRAGDEQARGRLGRWHPNAPADATLRDIQHALAREHGHESWTALKIAASNRPPADRDHAARVASFLQFACPDAPVMGPSSREMARNAAMRILSRHPVIAHDSIYTAVACGDIDEVTRILEDRPGWASENGGPRGWPPLLYLCNARLPIHAAGENAVAIARTLLDHGANPNSHYLAWDKYRYTALTGVLGGGEEEAATHPAAQALAQLLFERGVEPYDSQLMYNVFADTGSRARLHDDIVWLLDLIYTYSVQRGREADWSDPNWPMLDPWGKGHGAGFLLEAAIDRNLLTMARWLLSHGASPDGKRPQGQELLVRSPYQMAQRRGLTEMAALLLSYGATPETASPEEPAQDAFVTACLRLDRESVEAQLAAHPEYLRSPKAMFAAAQQDRADVAEFLLDLGVSPDVEASEGRLRALHEAAGHDSVAVAALLIDRGAEVDWRDSNWNATPLGWSIYGQRRRTMALLSRFSRDVFNLVFIGAVARLRALLAAEPDLAKVVNARGDTPLMWLPDDEQVAVEIAALLLEHGANPAIRRQDGTTAADMAMQRGLEDAAELIREACRAIRTGDKL